MLVLILYIGAKPMIPDIIQLRLHTKTIIVIHSDKHWNDFSFAPDAR